MIKPGDVMFIVYSIFMLAVRKKDYRPTWPSCGDFTSNFSLKELQTSSDNHKIGSSKKTIIPFHPEMSPKSRRQQTHTTPANSQAGLANSFAKADECHCPHPWERPSEFLNAVFCALYVAPVFFACAFCIFLLFSIFLADELLGGAWQS